MDAAELNKMSELSTRQTANLLNVSVRTIQLWVENGTLQAWKTAGGHRRISVGSVQQLLEEKQNKQTPIPRPFSNTSKSTVLIVDDDQDTLLLYKMLVSSWYPSLHVETANNGVDALVKVGSMRPCVLITDLQMPQLDGFAILDRLQNDEQYDFLTPIVVSGMSDEDIAARGVPQGVPILHKPIPVEELKELIAKAIH
ncbi:MAG: response regulator [Gammaproteobacteria bacterium]|nr:response regulator [Gammaproteobacteria bacterium]MCP4881348.1 response regulator [Gammaproteobacteria bacterium]MDP6164751.1 response regulator [Gammaproteobacteria bacterium]